MSRTIQVLVVDDSAVVRAAWRDLLDAEPDLELMGTATDPFVAARKMKLARPDVIVLDLEMPRMDGLSFLQRLMAQHPLPVVICSGLADRSKSTALRALKLGAVEVVPKDALTPGHPERRRLADAIRSAARSKLSPKRNPPPMPKSEPRQTADAVLPPFLPGRATPQISEPLVVIGASTGGTEAIERVLSSLDASCPGVVVVQHMPAAFTAAFSSRLDQCCLIQVRELTQRQPVRPGQALIAAGDVHAVVRRSGREYWAEPLQGPLVSRHRPSVDVLFRSAAMAGGRNVLALLLTGMGQDGAVGLLELSQAGAQTVAQDEASCVVYGMPRAAVEMGAAQEVLPLDRMADVIRTFGRVR